MLSLLSLSLSLLLLHLHLSPVFSTLTLHTSPPLFISTTPVPYNNVLLNGTFTGPLLSSPCPPLFVRRGRFFVGGFGGPGGGWGEGFRGGGDGAGDGGGAIPFVLLCNVTYSGVNTVLTCLPEEASSATAILSAPTIFVQDPGRNYYYLDHPPFMAPVFEISINDYEIVVEWLAKTNGSLNVTINRDGTNAWIDMFSSPAFIFSQVLVSCFACVCFIISFYFLTCLDWSTFPRLSHVCLLLEGFSNAIRMVWFAVDPIFSRHVFPSAMGTILETITLPLSLATSLLVGLFWHHVMQKQLGGLAASISGRSELSSLRPTFFTIITIIFILETMCDLCRIFLGSVTFTDYFQLINIVLYLLLNIGVLGFYIFTGFRLVRFLKKAPPSIGERAPRIRRIMILVNLTGIAVFLCVIINIMFGTPLFSRRVSFVALWISLILVVEFISFLKIISFNPHANQHASKTTQQNKERSSQYRSKELRSVSNNNYTDNSALEKEAEG